jgi:selenocysteine-specific elongation factor
LAIFWLTLAVCVSCRDCLWSDADTEAKAVRIAFSGKLLGKTFKWEAKELAQFKVYKNRERQGVCERLADDYTVIGKGLFSKQTDMSQFIGLKVRLDSGLEGTISSSFGTTGKFKVTFPQKIPEELIKTSGGGGGGEGKKKKKKPKRTIVSKITLHLKKYVYAIDRKAFRQ